MYDHLNTSLDMDDFLSGFNISDELINQLMSVTPRSIKLPPLPKISNPQVLAIAGLYTLLFFIGLYGNTAVLTYVLFLARTLRGSLFQLGSTFIYVVALCAVDSLVIFSLPICIVDLLLGYWMFGTGLCKLYWILESLSKFLSTFILTVLAFDRFLGVCHPAVSSHGLKTTLTVLLFCVLVAFACLSPVVYKAKASVVQTVGPVNLADTLVSMERIKCSDNLGAELRLFFSGYTFLIGYLIPASLIAFCYCRLLCHVRRQQRRMARSMLNVRRVTVNALAVTVFYFCCWTPYWGSQLYNFYHVVRMEYFGVQPERPKNTYIFLMYGLHALPYVNSAFNWIFYARLNSQFGKGMHMVMEKLNRDSQHRNAQHLEDFEHVNGFSVQNSLIYRPKTVQNGGGVHVHYEDEEDVFL